MLGRECPLEVAEGAVSLPDLLSRVEAAGLTETAHSMDILTRCNVRFQAHQAPSGYGPLPIHRGVRPRRGTAMACIHFVVALPNRRPSDPVWFPVLTPFCRWQPMDMGPAFVAIRLTMPEWVKEQCRPWAHQAGNTVFPMTLAAH